MDDSILTVEQSVLGLCLTDAANYLAVAQNLRPDDFGIAAHIAIWSAITDLYRSGAASDFVTVTTVLEKRGELSRMGGREYLSDLLLAPAQSESLDTYAKLLRAESLRRKGKQFGADLIAKMDAAVDPHVVYRAGVQELLNLDGSRGPQFRAAGEIVGEYEQEIYDRFAHPVTVVGVPTGFTDLDQLIGGWKPGFHILGARPSIGKTAFMLSAVINMADRHGVRVAIISIEMMERDFTNRLLAIRSGVPSMQIELGQENGHPLSAEQQRDVRLAVEWLKDVPIFVNAHSAPTSADVRISLQRFIASHNPDVAMLDHIHLMSSDDPHRRQNLTQTYTEISRNLKQIAKDLQIPLVCLAQLSRLNTAREDKHPQLPDLRESGSLEQDAAVVAFLHREDYYHKHDDKYMPTHRADLEVAKDQLGGRTDMIKMYFHERTAKFAELTFKPVP